MKRDLCTISEASISERSIVFWFAKIGGEFDHVGLPNPIEVNRTIGVRLGSIDERSIDYAGIYTRVLNYRRIKYDVIGNWSWRTLDHR